MSRQIRSNILVLGDSFSFQVNKGRILGNVSGCYVILTLIIRKADLNTRAPCIKKLNVNKKIKV